MRMLTAVAVAAIMLSMPAYAENGKFIGKEIDVSFPITQTRLKNLGYSNIQKINGDALHLSALDQQGSEVMLKISPQNGKIDSSAYVHEMDE